MKNFTLPSSLLTCVLRVKTNYYKLGCPKLIGHIIHFYPQCYLRPTKGYTVSSISRIVHCIDVYVRTAALLNLCIGLFVLSR